MVSKRVPTLLLLAGLCLFLPRLVAATAIANSTLNFSNLAIVPAAGLLTLDDVWLLQAFASANNSLGGNDAQFNFAFSPGTTSASAAVTWATSTGTATALGAPPNLNVSGSARSSVNIPGCNPAVAFSTGLGTLSNSFTVSGTGTVAVQFAVDIGGMLNVMTDACGLNAFTETIFTLAVDGGDPILMGLFDQHALNIGPSSSQTLPLGRHLTNTVSLDAGVSHFLLLQADSESHGQTRLPEPPSSTLLLVGFGALLWACRRGRQVGLIGRQARPSAARWGD
jgi:hypothetical protein